MKFKKKNVRDGRHIYRDEQTTLLLVKSRNELMMGEKHVFIIKIQNYYPVKIVNRLQTGERKTERKRERGKK